MMKIWARKPIAALQADADQAGALSARMHVPLKRTLGATSLMALGIGDIIGAGIFVLTGHAAAANAGPAIALSFLLGAVACALAGLCYAEMASTVPIAGSAYTYAYATMGELIAWIIGWDLALEYALGAATVAIGWSGYVVSFLKDFGITVPDAYSTAPVDFDSIARTWHATGALINARRQRSRSGSDARAVPAGGAPPLSGMTESTSGSILALRKPSAKRAERNGARTASSSSSVARMIATFMVATMSRTATWNQVTGTARIAFCAERRHQATSGAMAYEIATLHTRSIDKGAGTYSAERIIRASTSESLVFLFCRVILPKMQREPMLVVT